MILGFCLYYSSCQNLFKDSANNKLTNILLETPTKNNNSLTSTFHTLIPSLAIAIALAPIVPFILTLSLIILSTNDELFKKFMKMYLKAQVQPLTLASLFTKQVICFITTQLVVKSHELFYFFYYIGFKTYNRIENLYSN